MAARVNAGRVLCRSVMAVARRHPSLLEPLTAAIIAAAPVEEPERAATHVGRAAAHTHIHIHTHTHTHTHTHAINLRNKAA